MGVIPDTMLAWVKARDEEDGMELIECPVPSPSADQVLVKTYATSVCGTDLHIWKWDEWSQLEVPLNTITGHETCGVIVGLGENVNSHSIGDFIAVECHIADWTCDRCLEGNAHICENGNIFGVNVNGAFAPYFVIDAANARSTPSDIPSIHASVQDPLGNAIHTLMGGPVKDATIAIHGLGPIGLFAVDAARAMGAKKIIATDWDNDYRMEIAKQLGADIVLGKDDDIISTIFAETNGKGVDNSCEFSGAPLALSNAIKSTRMGGVLNILAVYGTDPIVPMNEIVFRYLKVNGINGRKMWKTWDVMHELLNEGNLQIEKVVTHSMPYADLQSAIQLMLKGTCGKIVLTFE